MTTTTKLISAEELLAMGDIGRCELMYGQVVRMSPSGFEHSKATAKIAWLLESWNQQHKLGIILGAEGGFIVQRNPDVVRAPDAAFVKRGRYGDVLPTGFFEGAPDLAVEVVSPSDTWPEVEGKVDMWLANGCQSCWVVDPRNRQVSIYRNDGTVIKLKQDQEIVDEAIPGFRARVAAVFEQ